MLIVADCMNVTPEGSLFIQDIKDCKRNQEHNQLVWHDSDGAVAKVGNRIAGGKRIRSTEKPGNTLEYVHRAHRNQPRVDFCLCCNHAVNGTEYKSGCQAGKYCKQDMIACCLVNNAEYHSRRHHHKANGQVNAACQYYERHRHCHNAQVSNIRCGSENNSRVKENAACQNSKQYNQCSQNQKHDEFIRYFHFLFHDAPPAVLLDLKILISETVAYTATSTIRP